MANSPIESRDYRYERKFLLSSLTLQEIEAIVNLHPAMFSEIFHSRYVNNIYFDSIAMKNYFDNVDGLAGRMKVRIRWYGDLFGNIEEPVLEFKIKQGSVGRKESFPLKGFSVDEHLELECLGDVLESSDIPESLRLNLGEMEALLLNRYRRKYFLSWDKKYRITLDSDLTYCPIVNTSFLHRYVDKTTVVLELKYGPENDRHADEVSSYFPFRMTRSSKYVNGINLAYLW